jgi:hypothetical protein
MNFNQAYIEMLKGNKIRRRGWKGYWFINNVTNKLTIHLANNKEITSSDDISVTIANTLAIDWEVADDCSDFSYWLKHIFDNNNVMCCSATCVSMGADLEKNDKISKGK